MYEYEGVEIDDAVTLNGLKKLQRWEKEGKELPEGWGRQVVGGLKIMKRNIQMLEGRLRKSRKQYREALKIAEDLDVKI